MLQIGPAAKILPVRVLHPALNEHFVRTVERALQVDQPGHQPPGTGRAAFAAWEIPAPFTLEDRPVNQLRKLHQRMPHVDDLVKPVAEQFRALRIPFFGLHRRKNLQEIAPILRDFVQILTPEKQYLLK